MSVVVDGYYPQGGYDIGCIISNATGIIVGSNPPYSWENDFLAWFSKFTNFTIPTVVQNAYISQTGAIVRQAAWHEDWLEGMANHIAHLTTLYIQQNNISENPTADELIAGSKPIGFDTSEGIGPLSISTDYSLIMKELEGWGLYNSTLFGQAFANKARTIGLAGSYVW